MLGVRPALLGLHGLHDVAEGLDLTGRQRRVLDDDGLAGRVHLGSATVALLEGLAPTAGGLLGLGQALRGHLGVSGHGRDPSGC